MVGRPAREALPEIVDQGIIELLDEVYETGKPVIWNRLPMQLQHRPDGPVESRILTFAYHPVRAPDGTITGLLAHGIDVTVEAEAEARTTRAEERYRLLVHNSPQTIYRQDPEGRFTDLSPAGAELLGIGEDEAIGLHFAEVVVKEDLPKAQDVFTRLMTGKDDQIEFELRVRRPSGDDRLIALTSAGVREDGVVVGVQGVARDITDEVGRERQLRRAAWLGSVATLVGGVAHELNNPLQAILGLTEIIADAGPPETLQGDLATMRREAARAARIVEDLRFLAARAQDRSERKEEVDIWDVVRHTLETRKYSLATKNIRVREKVEAGEFTVLGDAGRLEQVFLNLIVNAEHALDGWSGLRELRVRAEARAEHVRIVVADTGPGIPDGQLERIFDPFWTTKPPGEGTGLGLSLARGIIAEWGGTLHAEPHPDGGAAFVLELPTIGPNAVARAKHRTRPSSAGVPLRVLVVDDEPAIRSVVRRFLKTHGHHVDVASDGAEALVALETTEGGAGPYDVILSDLHMPGVGGDELFRRLVEAGKGAEGTVVFMTGDAMSGEAAKMLGAIDAPVLYKPMSLDDLLEAVESHAGAVSDVRPQAALDSLDDGSS